MEEEEEEEQEITVSQGARVVSKPFVVSVGLSVKSYTGTVMGLANAEVNPHQDSITSPLALLFSVSICARLP